MTCRRNHANGRKEDIIELIKMVKGGNEKAGMKTSRFMSTEKQVHMYTDGEEISTVTSYMFLESLIMSEGYK
jgi:hypothetical protein